MDLLKQAGFLAKKEPRKPTQASLRRAVSAAYYGLFHFLTYEAARVFAKDDRVQAVVKRTYDHVDIRKVSESFSKGQLPKTFSSLKPPLTVPDRLRDVAEAFVILQEARHDADYDTAKTFTRSQAPAHVQRANRAVEDWKTIRNDDSARLYIGCFVAWKSW